MAQLGAVLVVVDTLARCTVGADENSAKDMGAAVAALDELRQAAGACVLAVHHAGKNLEAGARGHTSLLGAADTMLRVGKTDDRLTLDQEKQKHREPGHRQSYRLARLGDSAALTIASDTDADALTARMSDALAALAAVETPAGVSFTLWADTATADGIAKATTARTRAKALETGLIATTSTSTDTNPRYALTDAGRSHVAEHLNTRGEQA